MTTTWTRRLGWLLGAPAGLIALSLLAVFLINLRDEPLLPGAARFLVLPDVPVKADDNGFFILAGMRAAPGADAHQAGTTWAENLVGHYKWRKPWPEFRTAELEAVSISGGSAGAWQSCKPDDCHADFIGRRDNYIDWSNANAVLLARYEQMRARAGFADIGVPAFDAPLPAFQPLLAAHELELARAVRLLHDGRPDDGMALMADLMQHTRRVLAGSRTVVSKMVAANMMQRAVATLGGTLNADPNRARKYADTISAMLAPLSARELDLGPAYDHEVRTVFNLVMDSAARRDDLHKVLSRPGTVPHAFLLRFYQPNATMNLLLPSADTLIAYGSADTELLDGARIQLDNAGAKLARQSELKALSGMQNPAGKVLIDVLGWPMNLAEYKLRLVDLEGYLVLARVHATLLATGVAPEARAAWLANSPQGLRNPYDRKIMQYDERRSVLRFRGKGGDNADFTLPMPG